MMRKRYMALVRLLTAVSLLWMVLAPSFTWDMRDRWNTRRDLGVGVVEASDASAPMGTARRDDPPPPEEAAMTTSALPTPVPSASTTATAPFTATIRLKSREFQPDETNLSALRGLSAAALGERVHVLIQLDFIPRQAAKDALAAQGIELLAYVPDYAWIASAPASRAPTIVDQPGVVWAGELRVEDKLAPAIVAEQWGEWNLAPDGTAAVYVALHKDERLDTGRDLVTAHGGEVMGEVVGINTLVVEMPQKNIRTLAAEDAIQWIEPAAPPLEGANDGSRPHIGVDVLQEAPYNLDGTNIDVLVYDSGQAGDHVDFGSRLTHGDSDFVSEHSTHVAGIVGGSGANSASHGGSALQWRGMAPSADLLSYGTGYAGSGYIFYQNVPDIEQDWAQAQNSYGADLANASLGSNVYGNYYPDCSIMGRYGAASVLIDQIVRGDNSVVGIGDKYITAWSVGNERGWWSSCAGDGGGYGLVAPPAAAKNPIHVGGSNTNNTTQYAHTSWGPTGDGRLKPIVTAGGCQTTGDFGIMSTDNLPANDYTTMCGTSMATPAVSGGIALMLQHYRDVYNTSGRFWPSTAKAILMQTAHDQGNPGPDYQWGYGLVDIQDAVDLISRKAFRQASVDDDEVDVYSFIVPSADENMRVSLAWDDVEATFNADPTLINDLDLELVAPDGTVWNPWILNAGSPTNNATRGVNTVDNQEQVEVPAASVEIGTWMVRVTGAEVPQGPQDYSLVCEGCEPLNVGVCQSKVAGTSATLRATSGQEVDPSDLDAKALAALEAEVSSTPTTPEPLLTEGEQWQRTLVSPTVDAPAVAHRTAQQAGLAALEAAKADGPEAVVALLDTLRGPALDAVIDEIQEAQERLAESTPPPPETAPVTQAEEQAALDAQRQIDAANRAQALASPEDAEEGQAAIPRIPPRQIHAPTAPTTHTVGAGCDYATIGAAVTAANPGDTLLIEGGVTFDENVTIPISLTLHGGYDGCDSGLSTPTTVDGGASGSVFEIYHTLVVTLENLMITNGNTGLDGGGVRFAAGAGTGNLTLNNVDIHNNIGYWGGGLWVGPDAEVNGYDVQIYDNTAGAYGGGVRLFGSRITLEHSSIHDNTAQWGGGVYATQEYGYNPVLNLPTSADLYDNQALTGDGFGGGLYLRQGTATVADCSDLYSNDAIQGGGAYLITSTLTVHGVCSEVNYNTATDDGGGVYAVGSTINLDEDAAIEHNDAGTGGSGSGGGAYLDDSDLYSDKASIHGNSAQNFGGGVYAINGSNFDMDLGSYTCLGPDCSQLYSNVAIGSYGGGVYLNNSNAWLDNTFVENNQSTLGGGVYAYESTVYLNNSLFAHNDASSGTGDGVRLYIGSNMIGQGNTFAYNDSGGAATGQAIGVSSANLTLNCSIIWGHTSSINQAGEDVTYSDVQGGYAGEGNLDVNPQFVSWGGQDYHLQTTSPLIDRCVSGVSPDFDNELRPIVRETAASPYDMGADEVSGAARVGLNGDGCDYATIRQAVNAAEDGDTLQIAEGVYFENVEIYDKDITLAGGYNSTCATAGAGASRVEGSVGSGSTLDIDYATVTLRDMEIAWGSGNGGGINAGSQAFVTLDNTDVHDNHGSYGGGLYIGTTSAMTLTNESDVHDNTASIYGGGARVWGTLIGVDTNSDINDNCAPHGGGASVAGGVLTLDASDMQGNEAADPSGMGGGIIADAGAQITLLGNAWVYGSAAYDGAGIYADGATVDLSGSVVSDNDAANYGGGVYLTNGSTLVGDSITSIGYASSASYVNTAQSGAGIYALDSTIDFEGRIIHNEAVEAGGGIYAKGSTLNLTDAQVGGTETYQMNQVTGGMFGAGLYFSDTHALLSNTVVASNTFSSGVGWGGGMVAWGGSVVTLTNDSRVERHHAPLSGWFGGSGAGLLVYSSTVTLDDSHVLSNTADIGGGGIYMVETSVLDVLNGSSIINNHALNGPGGGLAATDMPDINIADSTLRSNTAGTDGGAIHLDAGTLDLTGGWTLHSNEADGHGGAVAVLGTADADFDAGSYSFVYSNRAGGHGGAIYVGNGDTIRIYAVSGSEVYVYANQASESGGVLYSDSGATFDLYGQVNLDRNWASNGPGGAVYLGGGGKLWLDDFVTVAPELWDNRAYNNHGGAVYAAGGATVECDGAMLGREGDGNLAFAGSGGAIYLSGSTLDSDNCTFVDNEAENHGGAIAAYTSTLDIRANFASSLMSTREGRRAPNAPLATGCDPSAGPCSAFFSNVANSDGDTIGDGGALYTNDGSAHIAHTHFYSNTSVRGGAIYQTGSSAQADIANTLIYSNTSTAQFGAGIRTEGGAFTVTHVTLANNINGAGYSQSSTEGYAENSIAWGNENGGFWIISGPLTGTCNIDQSNNAGNATDPHFADAANGDFHLLGDSPAIDACATGLSPDLDNVLRPAIYGYDMGAFEYPYGVEFAPDRTGVGLPDTVITYTHTLTNIGGTDDAFTLTGDSAHGWPVTTDPAPTVTLAAGEAALITATIHVAAGVPSDTVDTAHITATSATDPALAAVVTDTTTIGFAPGVDFVPDHLTIGASTGTSYIYTHTLTNAGNATDTFHLAWGSSRNWGNLDTPGPFELGPAASAVVTVTVTVPGDGLNQSDTTVVTATSDGGAGPVVVRDTTSAFTPGVAFAPDNARDVSPETVVTYTHTLTNTGNATDTFYLTWDSSRGWAALLDPGPFTLIPDEMATVRVEVTVPPGAGGLTETTVVTATSDAGATPDTVTDITAVYPPGVALTPNYTDTLSPGAAITYTHTLTNTGAGPDTMDVGLATSSQGWATLVDPGPFPLNAGGATTVRIRVAAPSGSGGLVETTVLTAASRAGDAAAAVTDTTRVPRTYGVALAPDYTRDLMPGASHIYTHTLTNAGNSTDTFQLSRTSSQGWTTLLDSGPVTLTAGAAIPVRIQVDVPAGSGGQQDVTRLTATSIATAAITSAVTDTTTGIYMPDLTLTPEAYAESHAPGTLITYTHWLTNAGNGPERVTPSYHTSQGWATLVEDGMVFDLAAGEGITLNVRVNVPPGSGGLVETTHLTATAEHAALAVAATDTTTATHTPGLSLTPDYDRSVPPSTTEIYPHTLANTGNGPDTFTLAFSDQRGWAILLDPGPISLGAGETADVRVEVTVPSDLISGTLSDIAIVTATSAADPSLFDTATDTTTVGFAPGAIFVADEVITGAERDTSYDYTHTLTNTGNYTDTFILTFTTSAGWGALVDTGPFTLSYGEATNVGVRVDVPSDGEGKFDTTTVTATSKGGAGPVAVHDTTAAFEPDVTLTPDYTETRAPGEAITYAHTLENTGTSTDVIKLMLESGQGWATLLDPGPYTLAAGESITVRVVISIPMGSGGLSDLTTLTARTLNGFGPGATVTDTTHVSYSPGVALGPDHAATVPAGSAIIYTHDLTNTGNGPDTFALTTTSDLDWARLVDTGPFTLSAGASTAVRVEVTVPTDTLPFVVDTTILTATVDALAATARDTTTVECMPVSTANFHYTPIPAPLNRTLTFTGTASGSPSIAYTWDFDDGGGVQSGPLQTHIYTSTGSFNVVMTATNICPSVYTATRSLNVKAYPELTWTPAAIVVPLAPDDTTTRTLTLGNTGEAELDWTLAITGPAATDWLTTTSLVGTIAPDDTTPVIFDLDATGLTTGTYTATLLLTSNDPHHFETTIPVTLSVSTTQPDITVDPTALAVTVPRDETATRSVALGNVGNAALDWDVTVSPAVTWLTVAQTGGTLAPDDDISLTVQFDATGLTTGTHATSLRITSNDIDESPFILPVTLDVVAGEPDLTLSTLEVSALLQTDGRLTETVILGNVGEAALTWNLTETPSAAWLTTTPTSGTVAPGGDTSLALHFDAAGLPTADYTTTLRITSNDPDESPADIDVTLTIRPQMIYLPLVTRNF